MIGRQGGDAHTLSTLIVSLVATFGLGSLDAGTARAQSAGSPIHSLIHRGTSPPIYDLFGPDIRRMMARRLERILWRPPDRSEWPIDGEGEPVVETERLERLTHTVRPGQTVSRIREMYRTTWHRLRQWNPDADLSDLESGDRLIVWRRHHETVARSRGGSDWGWLEHGEPLPPGEKYEIQYPHRAFGTYYTISETKRVLSSYADRFPNGPKLLVGDISFRTGGSMHPHKSHRTGRDVDITYPRHDEPPSWRRFYDVPLSELDVRKTLFLVRTLLEGGYVQYIFIDRYIQRALRRHAAEMGAPESWLDAVFEYPAWDSHESTVRHAPGHRSHMHVRFWCQPTDRRCPY